MTNQFLVHGKSQYVCVCTVAFSRLGYFYFFSPSSMSTSENSNILLDLPLVQVPWALWYPTQAVRPGIESTKKPVFTSIRHSFFKLSAVHISLSSLLIWGNCRIHCNLHIYRPSIAVKEHIMSKKPRPDKFERAAPNDSITGSRARSPSCTLCRRCIIACSAFDKS